MLWCLSGLLHNAVNPVFSGGVGRVTVVAANADGAHRRKVVGATYNGCLFGSGIELLWAAISVF